MLLYTYIQLDDDGNTVNGTPDIKLAGDTGRTIRPTTTISLSLKLSYVH